MNSDQVPPDGISELSAQLAALRKQVQTIELRLSHLEQQQPPLAAEVVESFGEIEILEDAPAAPPTADIPPVAAMLPAARPQPNANLPPIHLPPQPITPPRPWPEAKSPVPTSNVVDQAINSLRSQLGEQWEDIVGGRWMTYAGAITLIVAMAFFIPWAWTELALPDWSKVFMLHAIGLGFVLGAWLLHRRELKIFAQGLAGIGIFTLYASAWAAQHHYQIWGNEGEQITFVECAAITLAAILAAVSARSVAIVLLGALGGYLTPIIASSGSENHVALFSYLAFLNVALIASAVIRSWSFLKPLSLLATMLMFAAWLVFGFSGDDTWSTQELLTLHWGIFLLGATLPPLIWQRRSNWFDLAALSINSMWFVGTTWLIFHERPEQQLALFCWGMTLLHLALFGATSRAVTNADRMPRTHLALAGIFFVLAAPLQLEDSISYLALAWSAQGLVITLVGIVFRDRKMCVTALLVFALALVRLFTGDFLDRPELIGNIDRRFLMALLTALMMIAAGALYPILAQVRSDEPSSKLDDNVFGGLLLAVGNIVAMLSLTLQWDTRIVLILWTIDAAILWAAGFYLQKFELRTYAMLLAILLVGGRAIQDGDSVPQPFLLIFNERLGSLLLLSGMFYSAAWTYRRWRQNQVAGSKSSPRLKPGEELLDPLLAVIASLVLVIACSWEIQSWFHAAGRPSAPSYAQSLNLARASYSILWAVLAAGAVIAGMLLRWPVLRYVGMAGFAITLLKVFFADLASLQLLPRVLALAVLGMMLLGVSLLYQKFRVKMKHHEARVT